MAVPSNRRSDVFQMPLSEPAPRTAIHVRHVECHGFEREDGLWDIEGLMVDAKTHAHQRRDGGEARAPGDPIHQMRIRLTIDLDFLIHECEAVTEASPYSGCGDIAPAFKALAGLKIGPGWRRRTLEVLGGTPSKPVRGLSYGKVQVGGDVIQLMPSQNPRVFAHGC